MPLEVFVAEAESQVLNFLMEMFTAFDLKVTVAQDSVSSVNILNGEKRYDLIILSCEMEGISAVEVCQKNILKGEHRPYFILSTSRAEKGFLESIAAAGADDILLLPSALSTFKVRLLIILRDAMARKKQNTEKPENDAMMRLANVGKIGADISHEISTPLTLILNYSEKIKILTQTPLLNDSEIQSIKRCNEKIQNAAERLSQIKKRFNAFIRNSESDPVEEVFLSEIINSALDFCFEKFERSNIEVRRPFLKNNYKLLCRPAEVSQVILNLLSNAFDAVDGCAEKWIEIDSRLDGQAVEISVIDSGPGVPESVREQIMRPFFTTKKEGRGTGLGLSISLESALRHHGQLYLNTNDQHTNFTLRLPLAS